MSELVLACYSKWKVVCFLSWNEPFQLHNQAGSLPMADLVGDEPPRLSFRRRESTDHEKAGATERYLCSFYPGGHVFDLGMQAEAFGWLDRWLKA